MAEVKNAGTLVWRIDPFHSSSGVRDGAKKADAFGDNNGRVTGTEIDNWIAHNEAIIAGGDPSKIYDYPSPEATAHNNIGEAQVLKSVIADGPPSVAAAALGVVIRKPMDGLEALFSRIFKNVI